MNHRPQGLEASKAIVGFLQYKGAEGLVPITFAGYERDLKFWLEHMGTLMLSKKITTYTVLLNYMRTDYGLGALPAIIPKNFLPKLYITSI